MLTETDRCPLTGDQPGPPPGTLDPDGLTYFERAGVHYRWMPDGVEAGRDELAVAFVERNETTGREYPGRLLIPHGDGRDARRLLASFNDLSPLFSYRLKD